MITEEMFDLMMYMIGYGDIMSNLLDALNDNYYNFDKDLILELAQMIDDGWNMGAVDFVKQSADKKKVGQ
jgi:hypothetical protein|tara:strand:+ start:910 stop:1119 length:210 start_codon:yes stop_codon:yes gene_type:complete